MNKMENLSGVEINSNYKNKIEKAIKTLSKYSSTKIVDIEYIPKVYKSYKFIKKLVNKYIDSKYYSTIRNIIKENYNPNGIKRGTLGSFLWSCFRKNPLHKKYGNIDIPREPDSFVNLTTFPEKKMLSSIQSKKYEDDFKYQIWISIYDKKLNDDEMDNNICRYTLISSRKSNHAYVYVKEYFKNFKQCEIEKFKKYGIEFIQVIKTYQSKNKIYIKMKPVDKLPVYKKINKNKIYQDSESCDFQMNINNKQNNKDFQKYGGDFKKNRYLRNYNYDFQKNVSSDTCRKNYTYIYKYIILIFIVIIIIRIIYIFMFSQN